MIADPESLLIARMIADGGSLRRDDGDEATGEYATADADGDAVAEVIGPMTDAAVDRESFGFCCCGVRGEGADEEDGEGDTEAEAEAETAEGVEEG